MSSIMFACGYIAAIGLFLAALALGLRTQYRQIPAAMPVVLASVSGAAMLGVAASVGILLYLCSRGIGQLWALPLLP